MEGLRGFAVTLVFLLHFAALSKPWLPADPDSFTEELLHAIPGIGNSGADLFFVLSGYLIYGSLLTRPQSFRSFFLRRIRRIYPTFTVVLALYVMLSRLFPADSKLPPTPALAIPYVAANFLLLPGIFPLEPLITVAWSLSFEMFFYLVTPLAITLFRRLSATRAPRVWVLTAATIALVITFRDHDQHIRLIMFLSGALLFEARDAGMSLPAPNLIGTLSLAAALVVKLVPIGGQTGFIFRATAIFVLFFLLCFSCFQDSTGPLSGAFTWPPVRWLGIMSYSYYLLHGLTLKAAFHFLPIPAVALSTARYWLLLPAMFMLTLIPAAALWLAVERPLSLSARHS